MWQGFFQRNLVCPLDKYKFTLEKLQFSPKQFCSTPAPPLNRQKHCGLLYLGLNELLVLLEERAYKESKILYKELLSI